VHRLHSTRRILALLLIVGGASPISAQDYRALGLEAFDAREFERAYEYLNAAYGENSGDAQVGARFFVSGLFLMKTALAESEFGKVVEVGDWIGTVDHDQIPNARGHLAALFCGRAYLSLDRPAEAITVLEQGRYDFPHPLLSATIAQAYYKNQDYSEAATAFDEYLAHEECQHEVEIYRLLALSRYRSGDVGSALKAVEEGLSRYAEDAVLIQLKDKFAKEYEVEGGLNAQTTWHFTVLFENVEEQKELRQRVLDVLERVYSRVTRQFSFYPKSFTSVVIYSSRSDYNAGVAGAPTWSTAVYNGKIRIPLGETSMDESGLETVLAHEFTHVVVDQISNGGSVPAWLNEGLAQIMEAKDMDWAEQRVKDGMKIQRRTGKGLLPLKSMGASFTGIRDSDSARLAYGEAYLFTSYLIDKYAFYRMIQIMEDLAGGSSLDEAIKWRLGTDIPSLEEKWLESQAETFRIPW